MIHGINNSFLYSAKMIVALWTNGTDRVKVTGTGFIIDKNGELILVTNRHVVEPGYAQIKYATYSVERFSVIGFQNN